MGGVGKFLNWVFLGIVYIGWFWDLFLGIMLIILVLYVVGV